MPFGVRKSQKGGYDIVKKLPGGRTQKVGHSTTKKKAKISASIRNRKSGHK